VTKSILLLAALEQEADAFCAGKGETVAGEPMVVRDVALASAKIRFVTCGLGKVNAALAVGRYADAKTDLVAMTGACGKIGAIDGDCFWIAQAIQHDYGARQPDGFVHYRAGDWPMGDARRPHFTAMADCGSGLVAAKILSGDVFLECADTARMLASGLDAQLLDMEVAAVAQAAEALGLPWCAIKAVTDGADHESAGDFSANLKRAASKSAVAMEQFLSSLRQ
jgi:adenosylhomocysteine nucleosidase